MTLATLKGMNFSVGDVANAFKLKTADTVMEGVHKASDTLAHAAQAVSGAASRVATLQPLRSPQPPLLRARRPSPRPRQAPRPMPGGRRLDRSHAMVGRTDAAVPADCRQRHEGCRQADSAGHHTQHGHRSGQGGPEDRYRHGCSGRAVGAGCRAACGSPCRVRASRPRAAAKAPARKAAARKAPAKRSPAKKAARKTTG
jgi:hypothetical protein